MRSTFVRAALVGALLAAGCGQGQSAPAPSAAATGTGLATQSPTAAPSTAAQATARPTPKPVPPIPPARAIRPVDTIEFAGGDGLVVAAGELWIRDADSVHSIDPTSGKVTRSVDIAEDFGPYAIAGDAVWITDFEDNAIVGFSLAKGREVARIPVGLHPNVVFEADGSIWGYNLHGRFIERIDPVARASAFSWTMNDLLGKPTAPLTDEAIWFGAYDHQRAIAVDPETNAIAASIDVGIGACGASTFPSFVLVGACNSRVVARVDAAAGTVLATERLAGFAYGWNNVGDLAWTVLAMADNAPTTQLVGFDPETLEPRDAVDVGSTILGVAIAFDSLWVTTSEGILRYDLAVLGG